MTTAFTYEEIYPASVFFLNQNQARVTCKRCGFDEWVKRNTLTTRLKRGMQDALYCNECRRIERRNRES